MRQYLIAYMATALVFFGLDYVWLSRIAANFYRTQIGSILSDRPNLTAAALFYLVYIAGIVHFAVNGALERESLNVALFNGALLGLVAYGTYDMTNLATLKNWPLNVTVIDMAWGTMLTSVAAGAGYLGGNSVFCPLIVSRACRSHSGSNPNAKISDCHVNELADRALQNSLLHLVPPCLNQVQER